MTWDSNSDVVRGKAKSILLSLPFLSFPSLLASLRSDTKASYMTLHKRPERNGQRQGIRSAGVSRLPTWLVGGYSREKASAKFEGCCSPKMVKDGGGGGEAGYLLGIVLEGYVRLCHWLGNDFDLIQVPTTGSETFIKSSVFKVRRSYSTLHKKVSSFF